VGAKRKALAAHDTLLLNSRLLSAWTAEWNESTIDARSETLIDALLRSSKGAPCRDRAATPFASGARLRHGTTDAKTDEREPAQGAR
jgi:hypothetical protein